MCRPTEDPRESGFPFGSSVIVGLIVASALCATVTHAAEGTASPQSVESAPENGASGSSGHLWTVTLSFFYTDHRRIARDTEQLMERAGLGDDVYSDFSTEPVEFPQSYSGSDPLLTCTIARSIRPDLQIALAFGRYDLGETMGFGEGGDRFPYSGDDWLLALGARTTSASLLVRRGGAIHAGLGPSLQWIEHWSKYDTDPGIDHTLRIGLAAEVGASWPADKRFFLEGLLRYQWIGSLRRGPFDLESSAGTLVVPESSIRLDYWVTTVGLGVRL